MKLFNIVSLGFTLALCSFYVTPVIAEDTGEEPIHHYAGANVQTKDQALSVLSENTDIIQRILEENDRLSGDAFEKIHEASYSLEDAVEELRADKALSDVDLDKLDEAVQALHYGSENHLEEVTRQWLGKMILVLDETHLIEKTKVTDQVQKDLYQIVIKDHIFTPETLSIPAGKKIKLEVVNDDPTPEEFESSDLGREKIIMGNSKANIFIGPLKPGTYGYFGEFNMDTAKGIIIAE